MSNTHSTLTSLFSDIADSIRAKTKSSDSIVADAFPDAIAAIKTGGTSVPIYPKAVNFYDYDGTLLYSYSVAEANALTELPSFPDHSSDMVPLTAQEWTHTLDEVKSTTKKLNVGAIYIPTDGKTHLIIDIQSKSYMTAFLYISQTVSGGVSIDWGDNSTVQTISGTGYVNTSHSYLSVGEYDIKLETAQGCDLGFGAGSTTYSVISNMGSNREGYIGSTRLKKCFIGTGVSSIGYYAFYNNSNLITITIPNNVTEIKTYAAFRQCSSLISIAIPRSISSIGNHAFLDCTSLSKVQIPNTVTSFGENTFSGCQSLSEFIIPSSATTMGYAMFNNGFLIDSIDIPYGVTSIPSSIFYKCYVLNSVSIPSSVTTISDSAFYSAYALTSITIPESVTTVKYGAFYSCRSMIEYHFLSSVPPVFPSGSVFYEIPSDCKIYVPKGSLTAYQTATNWSTYASYIVEEA